MPIIHSGYVTANSMLMFVACHNIIIKKKMVQANQRWHVNVLKSLRLKAAKTVVVEEIVVLLCHG